MMNTRLLVVAFCVVFLLGVSSVFAAQTLRIEANCSLSTINASCGETVWATCNVVDSFSVLSVNTVTFTVGGRQYPGSLLTGTALNGSWGVSIVIDDTMSSSLSFSSVSIVDSASNICSGGSNKDAGGCKLSFGSKLVSTNCVCTLVPTSNCNADNTGTITYAPSAGCSESSYTVNTICDYCDPQWSVTYSGCTMNTSANSSIGDPFLGVAKKSYTSGNPGCCLMTGLDSDCKVPLDSGSDIACVFDYWTNEGRDAEGTSATFRPKQLLNSTSSCTDAITGVELNGDRQPIRPLTYDFDRDGLTEMVVFTTTGFKMYNSDCSIQQTVTAYAGGWEGSASMIGITPFANNYIFDTVLGEVVDYPNSSAGFAAIATNSTSASSVNYFVVYFYNRTTSSWARTQNVLLGTNVRNASVHCFDRGAPNFLQSCLFMNTNNRLVTADPITGVVVERAAFLDGANNLTNERGRYPVFGSTVGGISLPNTVITHGLGNMSGTIYHVVFSCDYPGLNDCYGLSTTQYNSTNMSDLVVGSAYGDGSIPVYSVVRGVDTSNNNKPTVSLETVYVKPDGFSLNPNILQKLDDTSTTVIDCVSDPVRARCMPNIEGIGLLTHYNVTSSSAPVTQGAYTLLMSKSADIVFGGRGVLLPKIGAYAVAGQGSATSFTVQIFRISDGFLLSTITIGVGGLYSPAGIGITAEADGSYLYIAYGAYRQYYGTSYTLKVYKINSESSIQFMGDTSAGSATDVWLVAPQKVYSGGLVRTIHPDNITNVNPTYSSVLTAPDWFDRDALKVGYGANIYNYSLSTYTRTGLVATSTLGNLGTYNGDRASPLFYTSTGYLVSADSNFQSLTQIGIKNPFDTGSNPGFIELSGVVPSLKQEFIPGYIYNNSKIYTAYTDYSDGLNPEYHREPSAAGVPIYSATRMAYTALSSSTNVMLVSSYYLNQPGVASVKYWTYNSGASSGGETPVVVPYDEYACYVTNAGVIQKVWSKTEPSTVCKRSITAFDTNGDNIDELVSANGVYGANKQYYDFNPVVESSPTVETVDVNSDSFMDYLFLQEGEFKIIKSNPQNAISVGTNLSVGGVNCEYSASDNKIRAVATGVVAKYPTKVSFLGKLYLDSTLVSQYTPQWGVSEVSFSPSVAGTYRVDMVVRDEQAGQGPITRSCNVTVFEIAGNASVVGTSGCGFGSDGEFNYDDSVFNHNWYPMSTAYEPQMKDNTYAVFTSQNLKSNVESRYIVEIAHAMSCYDNMVQVDFSFIAFPMSTTKFVVQGEDRDGQSAVIGGIYVNNGKVYYLTPGGLSSAIDDADGLIHTYSLLFDTTTQKYSVQIDGGESTPLTNFVTGLAGEFTIVDVLHYVGKTSVDFIHVTGASGIKREVTKPGDVAKLALKKCTSPSDRNFTTSPPGDLNYDNIEAYCAELVRLDPKTRGESPYCTINDLQNAVKYNRLCFGEAYSYCVSVTFPQTNGFENDGETMAVDMSAGSAACLTALSFTAATDTIASPIWAVIKATILSNLWMFGAILTVIVVMAAFAMRRR